jgi:hypothetical protein
MFDSCPICGREVHWRELDLLPGLERYLFLAFVVGLAVRFRQYRTILGFCMKFPRQWPRLFEVAARYKGVFFTWTTLVPVGVTLLVLAAHSVCYHFVWHEAHVAAADLAENWALAVPVVLLAGLMLYLDIGALFGAGKFDIDAVERDLNRGEAVLRPRTAWTIRAATMFLVNPSRLVAKKVETALVAFNVALIHQMRRWAFHTAVRVCFGFSLWLAFATISGGLSTGGFWLALAAIVVGLGLVVDWIRPTAALDEPGSRTWLRWLWTLLRPGGKE